jgi:hypothetical protein
VRDRRKILESKFRNLDRAIERAIKHGGTQR